ncbi:MAG: hypothetical protein ACYDAO_02530 [Thermoplasmataceae archaeon]
MFRDLKPLKTCHICGGKILSGRGIVFNGSLIHRTCKPFISTRRGLRRLR